MHDTDHMAIVLRRNNSGNGYVRLMLMTTGEASRQRKQQGYARLSRSIRPMLAETSRPDPSSAILTCTLLLLSMPAHLVRG